MRSLPAHEADVVTACFHPERDRVPMYDHAEPPLIRFGDPWPEPVGFHCVRCNESVVKRSPLEK